MIDQLPVSGVLPYFGVYTSYLTQQISSKKMATATATRNIHQLLLVLNTQREQLEPIAGTDYQQLLQQLEAAVVEFQSVTGHHVRACRPRVATRPRGRRKATWKLCWSAGESTSESAGDMYPEESASDSEGEVCLGAAAKVHANAAQGTGGSLQADMGQPTSAQMSWYASNAMSWWRGLLHPLPAAQQPHLAVIIAAQQALLSTAAANPGQALLLQQQQQ